MWVEANIAWSSEFQYPVDDGLGCLGLDDDDGRLSLLWSVEQLDKGREYDTHKLVLVFF